MIFTYVLYVLTARCWFKYHYVRLWEGPRGVFLPDRWNRRTDRVITLFLYIWLASFPAKVFYLKLSHAYCESIMVSVSFSDYTTSARGKSMTVCLKLHITKTIKGSGPYALDCKHTAVFVTVSLRSNDITGKKSSAEPRSLWGSIVSVLWLAL